MAGSYCKFCDNRCFVERVIPSGPQMGWPGHLATCAEGKEHDRAQTGFDSSTAINPVTHPREAGLVRHLARLRQSQKLAKDMSEGRPGSYNAEAILADLVDDAEALFHYLTSSRTVFGICGSRLTDDTGPWTHHFVCTKEPAHDRHGDDEHEDFTRRGAPMAKWRDAVNSDGPIRIAIDADCPGCGKPERSFDPARQVFACSSLGSEPCGYESTERTA